MNLSMFGSVVATFGEAFCHPSMEDWMNVWSVTQDRNIENVARIVR
jgi:hypothetical protein